MFWLYFIRVTKQCDVVPKLKSENIVAYKQQIKKRKEKRTQYTHEHNDEGFVLVWICGHDKQPHK